MDRNLLKDWDFTLLNENNNSGGDGKTELQRAREKIEYLKNAVETCVDENEKLREFVYEHSFDHFKKEEYDRIADIFLKYFQYEDCEITPIKPPGIIISEPPKDFDYSICLPRNFEIRSNACEDDFGKESKVFYLIEVDSTFVLDPISRNFYSVRLHF